MRITLERFRQVSLARIKWGATGNMRKGVLFVFDRKLSSKSSMIFFSFEALHAMGLPIADFSEQPRDEVRKKLALIGHNIIRKKCHLRFFKSNTRKHDLMIHNHKEQNIIVDLSTKHSLAVHAGLGHYEGSLFSLGVGHGRLIWFSKTLMEGILKRVRRFNRAEDLLGYLLAIPELKLISGDSSEKATIRTWLERLKKLLVSSELLDHNAIEHIIVYCQGRLELYSQQGQIVYLTNMINWLIKEWSNAVIQHLKERFPENRLYNEVIRKDDVTRTIQTHQHTIYLHINELLFRLNLNDTVQIEEVFLFGNKVEGIVVEERKEGNYAAMDGKIVSIEAITYTLNGKRIKGKIIVGKDTTRAIVHKRQQLAEFSRLLLRTGEFLTRAQRNLLYNRLDAAYEQKKSLLTIFNSSSKRKRLRAIISVGNTLFNALFDGFLTRYCKPTFLGTQEVGRLGYNVHNFSDQQMELFISLQQELYKFFTNIIEQESGRTNAKLSTSQVGITFDKITAHNKIKKQAISFSGITEQVFKNRVVGIRSLTYEIGGNFLPGEVIVFDRSKELVYRFATIVDKITFLDSQIKRKLGKRFTAIIDEGDLENRALPFMHVTFATILEEVNNRYFYREKRTGNYTLRNEFAVAEKLISSRKYINQVLGQLYTLFQEILDNYNVKAQIIPQYWLLALDTSAVQVQNVESFLTNKASSGQIIMKVLRVPYRKSGILNKGVVVGMQMIGTDMPVEKIRKKAA